MSDFWCWCGSDVDKPHYLPMHPWNTKNRILQGFCNPHSKSTQSRWLETISLDISWQQAAHILFYLLELISGPLWRSSRFGQEYCWIRILSDRPSRFCWIQWETTVWCRLRRRCGLCFIFRIGCWDKGWQLSILFWVIRRRCRGWVVVCIIWCSTLRFQGRFADISRDSSFGDLTFILSNVWSKTFTSIYKGQLWLTLQLRWEWSRTSDL